MLPYLAPLLFKLRAVKQEHDAVQAKTNEVASRMRTNGHGLADDLRKAQAELQKSVAEIDGLVERISEMGCELKDVDMGLIDFRTEMEGREVYLCWRLGEEHISYWHEMDAGFAGRQSLGHPDD